MDDVDANSGRGELEGGDAGELGDSGFGDRVGGGAWSGGGVVPRADDDDARREGALFEVGDGELEEALGGGEVDLDVEVPGFEEVFDVFAGFEDAGVGDDEVEAAVLGDGGVDGGLHGGVIGDVADDSGEAFAGEVFDDRWIDVEADDGGSVVAEAFDGGATDAASGSGDDGYFISVDLIRHDFVGLGWGGLSADFVD